MAIGEIIYRLEWRNTYILNQMHNTVVLVSMRMAPRRPEHVTKRLNHTLCKEWRSVKADIGKSLKGQ